MRLLIYELGPQALEQDILTRALQRRLDAVEGRVGIDAELLLGKVPILPHEVEEELYYIAIEALNNALKHAHATTVHVQLGLELEELHLEVIDNGVGFDPTAERSGGLGLISMGERARRLGGQLTITSTVEVRTTIHLVVPYTSPNGIWERRVRPPLPVFGYRYFDTTGKKTCQIVTGGACTVIVTTTGAELAWPSLAW